MLAKPEADCNWEAGGGGSWGTLADWPWGGTLWFVWGYAAAADVVWGVVKNFDCTWIWKSQNKNYTYSFNINTDYKSLILGVPGHFEN